MGQNKARVYFSNSKNARIHNLDNPCPAGKFITEGNYEDFTTYADAVAEILKRNKRPVDCKWCERKGGWLKNK